MENQFGKFIMLIINMKFEKKLLPTFEWQINAQLADGWQEKVEKEIITDKKTSSTMSLDLFEENRIMHG